MNKAKISLAGLALAILVVTVYFLSSSRSNGTATVGKSAPPVPVTISKALNADMPIMLDIVGRAEAYENVTMKSRLDGQVAAVLYTEGQHVKQGDILLRLDPGDFEAKQHQAEANLARDEAQRAKAHADIERYVVLRGKGFVSEEKVNELRTIEAAAIATAKADKAALDLARLQVSYTTLRAPFNGVVGARLVFPGTAVKINDTALAVVNRIRPLYVTFSVSEKHLPRLRAALTKGQMTALISIPGSKEKAFDGTVRFIDNAVDTSTGTIQLKAQVENQDEALTPGQFLNVSIHLDTLTNSVVVPNEAVQQGADGNFLFVVKDDNKVESRKIVVAASYGTQTAISQGLAVGETVVTDGQLRLSPGATISVKAPEQPGATPPTRP